jgi:regulator of sigma E protease
MIQIAQILFILSVLVILHEFGHYITAKMFKVRVEKFYLFIDAGFSIVKKKIGDTVWGIGWLPLGGYVKLSGMIDESLDTAQMSEKAQPWEFRAKPAWQRLIIMLGGIIVNILLAIFIYSTMFATVGQKYVSSEAIQKNGLAFGTVGKSVGFKNGDKIISVDGKFQPKFNWMIIDVLLSDTIEIERNGKRENIVLTDEQKGEIISTEGKEFVQPRVKQAIIDSVIPKSEAFKAGFKRGDIILAVNQKPCAYFDEFSDELASHKNDSVAITVRRDNAETVIKTLVTKEGKLGFKPKFSERADYLITKKHTLLSAIPLAIKESWQLFYYNLKQFKLILKPNTGAYKQVKSPVGIARQLPDTWDWEFVWNFTALFSIGLAFMNLLPIPGLDGGHALFTIAEMVTGRKLSDKAMEYVQTGGMIFLLSLMALTFGKDIYQLIADKLF